MILKNIFLRSLLSPFVKFQPLSLSLLQKSEFARKVTAKNKQVIDHHVFNEKMLKQLTNPVDQKDITSDQVMPIIHQVESSSVVDKPTSAKSSENFLTTTPPAKKKIPTTIGKRIIFKASKEASFKTVQNSQDDIEDSENKRVEMLKDRKIQEQIQFERLRKAAMNEERLSKFLSRSGVCSRRQAEKMINEGLIKVDGKSVSTNVAVTPANSIEIFTKRGEKFAPCRQNAKIWIFYKPRGLICSHDDPLRRPTIFDYIYTNTSLKEPHIKAVGRLDFNSEGLMLLTNDGDVAQCLEQPESHIYRRYRVRVQGKLDEEKFIKLKQGTVISGVQYGPYDVEIDRRQTTNTWLSIGLYTGKNREIRKVMQKFDLRVSRLKRETYGPYKIGKMLPGQLFETYVNDEVKRKIYLYMRKKLQLTQGDMKTYLTEKFGEEIFLENKSEEDLTLDKLARKVYAELDQNSLKTQLLE